MIVPRLKRCAHCRGEAELTSGGPGNHYVRCTSCKLSTDDGSVERAVASWNRRVPPLWWRVLFEGLNVACALTELAAGRRAADWVSAKGVALLVRIAP